MKLITKDMTIGELLSLSESIAPTIKAQAARGIRISQRIETMEAEMSPGSSRPKSL